MNSIGIRVVTYGLQESPYPHLRVIRRLGARILFSTINHHGTQTVPGLGLRGEALRGQEPPDPVHAGWLRPRVHRQCHPLRSPLPWEQRRCASVQGSARGARRAAEKGPGEKQRKEADKRQREEDSLEAQREARAAPGGDRSSGGGSSAPGSGRRRSSICESTPVIGCRAGPESGRVAAEAGQCAASIAGPHAAPWPAARRALSHAPRTERCPGLPGSDAARPPPARRLASLLPKPTAPRLTSSSWTSSRRGDCRSPL
jgi:hypothetical protein